MEQKIRDSVTRIAKAREQMNEALTAAAGASFASYSTAPWIRVNAGIKNIAMAFNVPIETISTDGDSALMVYIPALNMTLFQRTTE